MRKASGGTGLGYVVKMPYRQPCLHGWGGIQYVGVRSLEEGICCSEGNGERLYIAMEYLLGYSI